MQAKSANFVLCSKFKRKFAAFRAIIRWNKGRYFVEFSVPHRNFAIISDISLADTRNFAWNRIVVLQHSCKVLHATDTIGWSCNLHEIYFDNCLKLCTVIYHVYLSFINAEDKTHSEHKVIGKKVAKRFQVGCWLGFSYRREGLTQHNLPFYSTKTSRSVCSMN